MTQVGPASTTTPTHTPPRSLLREVLAVLLLMFGALALVVGWLVGVVLLWRSPRWSVGEKLLGTLVWPLGYPGVLFLLTSASGATECVSLDGGPDTCITAGPGPLGWLLMVVLVAAPLVVGAFLLVRAHLRRRLEQPAA